MKAIFIIEGNKVLFPQDFFDSPGSTFSLKFLLEIKKSSIKSGFVILELSNYLKEWHERFPPRKVLGAGQVQIWTLFEYI